MTAVAHHITKKLLNDGTILWVGFKSEHRANVMTRGLLKDLRAVIHELETDPGMVRILVLEGGQRMFCAGVDKAELTIMTKEEHYQFLLDEHEFWRAIEKLPIVSVASVAGPAVGFGAHLALCCDFRVASEDVRIGLPEIKLGVAATAQRVARFVGIARAKEILLTGRLLPADIALQWGMLTEVVERELLEERTISFAARLALLSRDALAMAKASVENAFKWDSSQHTREVETVLSSIDSANFREAMTASAEKREPKFS